MELVIKNMVCNRCIRVVREELEKLSVTVNNVKLGFAEIADNTPQIPLSLIQEVLKKEGFELIQDERLSIVEHIKRLIINEIHHQGNEKLSSQNFSNFLVKKMNYDYSYLSNLFSSIEKITIEKFIIAQKIERTKELLSNGEKTLSEISWELDYSSVAHLSNQFKQVTGLSPSKYKEQNFPQRSPIDAITKNHVTLK